MKVVLSGGTGVIGAAAVRALLDAGHEVVVLTRSTGNVDVVRRLGAVPVSANLFEVDSLVPVYEGADAVVSLATAVPVGYAALLPGAWRGNDELRTRGVANVVAAARRAGVRRVVQESISCLYADAGDDWVTEASPIEITKATEPATCAEAEVQDYSCNSRTGVVLRFGMVVGDDPQTRHWLRAARHGRPVGLGSPDGWAHLVHTDDLGPAVVSALAAPSGVYNVGADPVRRSELVSGYARCVGAGAGGFLGPTLQRLAGPRIEPLTRSLRVCSDRFVASTGWQPTRPQFDPGWFDVARRMAGAR
ncbi:MAG: NAD-dependent epimerase/dehydratase family protein [Marmoricola sp.]